MQVERWGPQLADVTEFFAQLDAIDTSGVEPSLTAASSEGSHQRQDKPVQHPMAADFLAQLPDREGDFIKVPKIRTDADERDQ